MSISRRVTLGWITAAAAGAWALTGCEVEAAPATAGASAVAPWPDLTLPPVTVAGYGQDPDLKQAMVTWPLTLTPQQRDLVRACAELILPADDASPSGGAVGLDAFFDEWLSAPYPQQRGDRAAIVPGLAWLDAEAARRSGADFIATDNATRHAILDAIAWRDKVQPGYERAARFFARLRGLMLAGYYSTPEGIADLGYAGNTPVLGPYPGPTPEALAHLDAALVKMGLKTG
ncbi:MAG TPA: gluconate 2-dehydrogenase subunit 3 family protein [Rhizomicrobium sp.]